MGPDLCTRPGNFEFAAAQYKMIFDRTSTNELAYEIDHSVPVRLWNNRPR
jgi:hypothetical protein